MGAAVNRHAHRSEHTGNAGQDRQQENVRALTSHVQRLLEAVARTHGVGVKRVQMQDKTYTLTPLDLEGALIIFSGPLTAGRTVLVPRVTDANGYGRLFVNATGQSLTFRNADGDSTLTFASGAGYFFISATGPARYL